MISKNNCGCGEQFIGGPGVGKSFSFYNKPQNCFIKDNCFRGSYVL